jgi:hypothetical protein
VCSVLVCNMLPPGESVLAYCTDKSTGDIDSLRDCLLHLARLHSWHAVIDISGLPINQHSMGRAPRRSRRSVLRDTLRTSEMLRERLADAFDVNGGSVDDRLDAAVDELYVTCVYHPDVQMLMRVLPRARKFYYPHGFGGLSPSELRYYEPFLRGGRRGPHSLGKDLIRRLLWGPDAVPLRTATLDGAYSFDLTMPWARQQFSLSQLESEAVMKDLFGRLPDEVRAYFGKLADSCSGRPGLLLIAGKGSIDPDGEETEIEAHVHVARSMVMRHHLTSMLVKPHPMGSSDWTERIIARVRAELPDVGLTTIEHFHHYSIEIVLVPFSILCAGTVLSTTLRNIAKIYGVPCYCPESRLLAVWGRSSRAEVAAEWVAQSRVHYIAV